MNKTMMAVHGAMLILLLTIGTCLAIFGDFDMDSNDIIFNLFYYGMCFVTNSLLAYIIYKTNDTRA
jgi:hypothetical protein